MIKPSFFVVVLMFILLNSCSLIKPQHPEFYCKINGKVFTTDTEMTPIGGVGSDPLSVTFDKSVGSFAIIARKVPHSISLFIKLQKKKICK